jgi:hypothetical protein
MERHRISGISRHHRQNLRNSCHSSGVSWSSFDYSSVQARAYRIQAKFSVQPSCKLGSVENWIVRISKHFCAQYSSAARVLIMFDQHLPFTLANISWHAAKSWSIYFNGNSLCVKLNKNCFSIINLLIHPILTII